MHVVREDVQHVRCYLFDPVVVHSQVSQAAGEVRGNAAQVVVL